jgi:hypothetical protein
MLFLVPYNIPITVNLQLNKKLNYTSGSKDKNKVQQYQAQQDITYEKFNNIRKQRDIT